MAILDNARKMTDKKLAKMERHISDIYKKSEKGITKKWNAYMNEANNKLADLQKAYIDAKKSGDKELIKQTGKRLGQEKRMVTIMDNKYKSMVEETTRKIADANQTALAYLNGELPSIYALNYNQAKEIAEQVDIAFNLVNEETVKNMIINQDIVLPQMSKRLSYSKDMRWNTKQINSSVLQGILQGESMKEISEHIFPEIMSKTDLKGKSEEEIQGIIKKNKQAAIRTARTSVTGAENRGRLDSYHKLEEDGAVMKKVWIATGDDRTRDWHLSMDGQEVDVDDNFVDGNGNKLEYPGDPNAAPETVYNCRCTMVTNIIGFRKADGHVEKIDYDEKGISQHEKEIEREKKEREKNK